MSKEKQPLPRLIVHYRGDRFMTEPGHSIYKLSLLTGNVTKAALWPKINWRFWEKKEREYIVINTPNTMCLPAKNIYKASVLFRQATAKMERDFKVQIVKD